MSFLANQLPAEVLDAGGLVARTGEHIMVIGTSGAGAPALSLLTVAQRAELNAWADGQPARNGCVDLAAWPGWAEVKSSGNN